MYFTFYRVEDRLLFSEQLKTILHVNLQNTEEEIRCVFDDI